MPAVIIAENVRGLRPYLPVLRLEYERHGYTAHIEMFNSKYWNVPQNRDRYAVVGTRDKKNLSFTFPKEQHEFVPKLSDYLEKRVPDDWISPDGMHVTEAFHHYARPLIQAELTPIYIDGVPRHLHLH